MIRLWVHSTPFLSTSKDAHAENDKGCKGDGDRYAKLWTSRIECRDY